MAPFHHAPCQHLPSSTVLPRRSVRPEAAFGKFRDARQQPSTCKPCPFHSVQHGKRRRRVLAAETGQLGAADLPPEEPEQPTYSVQVFPRTKEKDPYRLLGVEHAATFEEVQDARNYLYEEFKAHGRSREAIEMAFDAILKQKMKVRHKYGFKPPKSGRRSDVEGDPTKKNLWQKFRDLLEPSVAGPTIVNDGSIFLALGIWSAWQSASSDPTLPLGAAICFCTYRLFDKRRKRNPEGPYWGNSPVWGALGATVLGLVVGGLVAWLTVRYAPFPAGWRPEAVGLFVLNAMLGALAICFK